MEDKNKKERKSFIEDLLTNSNLTDRQKAEILSDSFHEEIKSLGEDKEKPKHWPGRYMPKIEKGSYFWVTPSAFEEEGICRSGAVDSAFELLTFHRMTGTCCKTQKEADLAQRSLKAKLKLIDTLVELNDGWEPDWKNHTLKYYFSFDHNCKSLDIWSSRVVQKPVDYFYGKSEEVMQKTIELLGEETIKLALFPAFKAKEHYDHY